MLCLVDSLRWRRNVKFIRYSRRARDQALAKWLRAVQHWETHTLRQAMKALRVALDERMKKNATAQANYLQHLRRRALRGLYRAVQARKQRPMLLLLALQHWSQYTQRLAWRAWRGVVADTKQREALTVQRQQLRRLTGAWKRWRAGLYVLLGEG